MLHELGNKVKRMEKLGSIDILCEVHEAAEKLQNKVDKKSYLLVHAESWEIGSRQKVLEDPQEFFGLDDARVEFNQSKSCSEARHDLESLTLSRSWDLGNLGADYITRESGAADLSMKPNAVPEGGESKTYENASSLSLATFISLLIEFVARLQNLVDSFEELSEKANFKEPVEHSQPAEEVRVWTRLIGYMRFKKKDQPLLG